MFAYSPPSIRQVVVQTRQRHELRRRRPHGVTYDPDRRTDPVVYYLCPDDDQPSGGIRNIYRHVDVLNALGIPAAVVHGRVGFRCTWFPNETRVMYGSRTTVGLRDVLIVPEYNAPMLATIPGPIRKVIFNQNAYQTFRHIPFLHTPPGAPYADTPNLLAILTVSQDNAALLRFTFPRLPVATARLVIDGNIFRPAPATAPRERRIGYLPRRRSTEQQELLHILRARGTLTDWRLNPIEGLSETETAAAMRACPLFLSFSEREGFGLPPAEAMASGAYVIGFTGLGGRDFFDPRYCTPVPESDLLAFATAIEETTRRYEQDPESIQRAGGLASERVLASYDVAGLSADLATFYKELL